MMSHANLSPPYVNSCIRANLLDEESFSAIIYGHHLSKRTERLVVSFSPDKPDYISSIIAHYGPLYGKQKVFHVR